MKTFLEHIVDKLNKLPTFDKKFKNPKSPPHKVVAGPVLPTQTVEVDIPTNVIIKGVVVVALFLALGKIFVQLQSITTITFICLFLALGLSPFVGSLERHRIPRPLAILLIYLIFLSMLGLLFYTIVPILSEQLLAMSLDLNTFFSEKWMQEILVRFHFDPVTAQQFISDNIFNISQNKLNFQNCSVYYNRDLHKFFRKY